MFDTIFENGTFTTSSLLICLAVSLVCGIILSSMCFYKTKSSKSFLIAIALLPVAVTMVIALVNGNVGAGIAIVGAFSLVRFRSIPGSAKEICIIFVAMVTGLAFGMGYIAYGILFMLVSGLLLMLFSKLNIWEKKAKPQDKVLKITIPEDLDYTNVFNDVFEKYLISFELIKSKTTNMGSMFKLTYKVTLKNIQQEKQLIDDLRIKNGNLEVMLTRADSETNEL